MIFMLIIHAIEIPKLIIVSLKYLADGDHKIRHGIRCSVVSKRDEKCRLHAPAQDK